jgi:hypothetical protein
MGQVITSVGEIEYDDELSFRSFVNETPLDLSGKVIYASSFYHEKPATPFVGMSNVTFVNCNLDNCFIPDGMYLVDCSTRKFAVNPKDGKDWFLDGTGTIFVEALN